MLLSPRLVAQAAAAVRNADALLITAGAGMGVDAGLPDFRGPEGFWRAYPPFRGKRFEEMSNPIWFKRDPAVAWGFFGHRHFLYSKTQPHAGYAVLRRWASEVVPAHFVFTSNVDGHFERAGFARESVYECHGSLSRAQCSSSSCRQPVFDMSSLGLDAAHLDEAAVRWTGPMPSCPTCSAVARPNVLMFGDYGYDEEISDEQSRRFQQFLDSLSTSSRLVIVEAGAGSYVPTVRRTSEAVASSRASSTLIRINPAEPDADGSVDGYTFVGFAAGAKQVLEEMDGELRK